VPFQVTHNGAVVEPIFIAHLAPIRTRNLTSGLIMLAAGMTMAKFRKVLMFLVSSVLLIMTLGYQRQIGLFRVHMENGAGLRFLDLAAGIISHINAGRRVAGVDGLVLNMCGAARSG